jgi:acyl-CoA synthetase (AMP-forming)/AMP-acid ligase II
VLLADLLGRVSAVDAGKRLVLLDDAGSPPGTSLPVAAEYEALLAASDPAHAFPELDEDTLATTFYTTGTTGLPKGVTYSHRQLVLHTMATRAALAGTGHGKLNEGDVYIVVRAPWLTEGYLKDRQASERPWAGGWLHTGDIAVIVSKYAVPERVILVDALPRTSVGKLDKKALRAAHASGALCGSAASEPAAQPDASVAA